MNSWIAQTLKRAAWAPLLVFFGFVGLAKFSDLYVNFPNFDMPTHFFGGLAMAYFFTVALCNYQSITGQMHKSIILLLSVSLTATTAVFWEFLEFIADRGFGSHLNLGVTDTLSDLLMGIAGAIAYALIEHRRDINRFADH